MPWRPRFFSAVLAWFLKPHMSAPGNFPHRAGNPPRTTFANVSRSTNLAMFCAPR